VLKTEEMIIYLASNRTKKDRKDPSLRSKPPIAEHFDRTFDADDMAYVHF